jgi:hypothetical protein
MDCHLPYFVPRALHLDERHRPAAAHCLMEHMNVQQFHSTQGRVESNCQQARLHGWYPIPIGSLAGCKPRSLLFLTTVTYLLRPCSAPMNRRPLSCLMPLLAGRQLGLEHSGTAGVLVSAEPAATAARCCPRTGARHGAADAAGTVAVEALRWHTATATRRQTRRASGALRSSVGATLSGG